MKILKQKKYRVLSVLAKYSFVIVIVFAMAMPFVFIQANQSPVLKINTKINNPLGDSIKDIPSFIKAIINIVLTVGVPIVVLAIIYAGFLFVTAQGNEEKLKTAKKTFLYTIIGAAILLGAFVIANAIRGTVEEIKKTT